MRFCGKWFRPSPSVSSLLRNPKRKHLCAWRPDTQAKNGKSNFGKLRFKVCLRAGPKPRLFSTASWSTPTQTAFTKMQSKKEMTKLQCLEGSLVHVYLPKHSHPLNMSTCVQHVLAKTFWQLRRLWMQSLELMQKEKSGDQLIASHFADVLHRAWPRSKTWPLWSWCPVHKKQTFVLPELGW